MRHYDQQIELFMLRTLLQLLVVSIAVVPAFVSESYAGACASEIDAMQARVDARIEALARSGRLAPESFGALLHHQPTPGSIAEAESRVGDASRMAQAANAAIARAREADLKGHQRACEEALADAQRVIGE
jgi:hypothetical protein